MTDAAKISSANQNPWTTTGTTTGTRIPTDPNVMFYDHGQSSVEPTTTLESAADDFFAGWNRQMTEPQQQSQQQYHLSQHQDHRTQTQPSHHGMAIQNLVYPDYSLANTTTFQPPVSMTGALGIQPADHHVTDEHLLQAPYYDPATSVVSNEEPYVARLPDPGWTPSAEAQRAATERSKLDSFDGSNSSLGHECNQQDGLTCRSSTNFQDGGHESGRHAQAPAESYNSTAHGTQSIAWTDREKDCLKAVLLMDDCTRYRRVKFVMEQSGYPQRSREGYRRLIQKCRKRRTIRQTTAEHQRQLCSKQDRGETTTVAQT